MQRPRETVFAWRLSIVRARLGVTIPVFSETCGVSKSSMKNWLDDSCEPLVSYAAKVASATGYDIDDLINPDVDMPPRRRRDPVQVQTHLLLKGAVLSTGFADGLRWALSLRGVTIKDLAADIDVARSQVQRWASGDAEPRVTSALRTADRLDVTVRELINYGRG